jgi:hypothetical protein
VRSRFERNVRLRLAGTEVEVIEIVWNRLIEGWQLGINQQVVMTRIDAIWASGRDPHLMQTEADVYLCRNSSLSARRNRPQRLLARASGRRFALALMPHRIWRSRR